MNNKATYSRTAIVENPTGATKIPNDGLANKNAGGCMAPNAINDGLGAPENK